MHHRFWSGSYWWQQRKKKRHFENDTRAEEKKFALFKLYGNSYDSRGQIITSQHISTTLFNQFTETSPAFVSQINSSFFVATHFSLHHDLSALSIFHYYTSIDNVTTLSRSLTSCDHLDQRYEQRLVQSLLEDNMCHCILDRDNLRREPFPQKQ